MKKLTPIALIALLVIMGQGCQQPDTNPIIARINGVELRRSQLQEAIQRRAAFLQQAGQPLPQDLNQQALQMLIQNEILYQEGSRMDIPDIEPLVEQRYREVLARFPSEEIFQSSLQRANTNQEQVRNNIRRDVIINNLVENVIGGDISISDKQAKDFYKKSKKQLKRPETVHARQILISQPPGFTAEEDAASQEKIAEILARLKKGELFEELAIIYSDHPSSSRGGDMGIITRGIMDPAFEKAAFSAKVDHVAGPVKTAEGYHLILVGSKEKAGIPSFKEIKGQIIERLRREKINEKTSAFLGDVASRSNIEILPQMPPR